MRLTIHTDGGSRGNPGPAAWGVLVEKEYVADGMQTTETTPLRGHLGIATNNMAEHCAMSEALRYAWNYRNRGLREVTIFSDSKLIVNQVTGVWAVKHAELEPLALGSQATLANLREMGINVDIQHVRREFNRDADHLVNMALDKVQ